MTKLTQEFMDFEINAPFRGQLFYRDQDIIGFADLPTN